MPFTKTKDRRKMDRIQAMTRELRDLMIDIKPGDRCFLEYRRMMREWKKNTGWTTADTLAANLLPDEQARAYFLAFLVFFNLHVMPYERMKQRENGDITGEA